MAQVIYTIENIIYLKKNYSKMDLITADGGFDFSNDFNKQEELSELFFVKYCSCYTKNKWYFCL